MTLSEAAARAVRNAIQDNDLRVKDVAKKAGVHWTIVYHVMNGISVRSSSMEFVLEALGLEVSIKPKEVRR